MKICINEREYSKMILRCLIGIILFTSGCRALNTTRYDEKSIQPMSIEKFVVNPFSFQPTLRNFNQKLPASFKVKIFTMKNRYNTNLTDSIFKYIHGTSELVIYKASGREMFIGGNLCDKNIKLKNGLQIGFSHDQFFSCFTDIKKMDLDTIRILSKKSNNKVNFIFKNDRLKTVKIDNFID